MLFPLFADCSLWYDSLWCLKLNSSHDKLSGEGTRSTHASCYAALRDVPCNNGNEDDLVDLPPVSFQLGADAHLCFDLLDQLLTSQL